MLVAAAMVAGIALSQLGVRFDGFLDIHLSRRPVPVASALADQAVAVVLPAGLAWILARLLNARRDPAQLLVAVGVLRVPAALAAALLVVVMPAPLGGAPVARSPEVFVLAAIVLAVLGWQIVLLVFGIRHATGLAGGRLAAAVVTLIVAAEVLSKLAFGLV